MAAPLNRATTLAGPPTRPVTSRRAKPAILLTDVPITTIGGVRYASSCSRSTSPKGTRGSRSTSCGFSCRRPRRTGENYDSSTGKLGGLTAVYDMDGGRPEQ